MRVTSFVHGQCRMGRASTARLKTGRVCATLAIFTIAATLAAGSQAAPSALPQTVTLRDTTDDVVGRGRRQHGRGDLDIRSVTLTRTSAVLRIVVETVAPLRSGSYVRFRYRDPQWGGEQIWFDAEVGPRGRVLVYVNDDHGPGTTTLATVGISGRRYALTLDFAPRGYLQRYRRFGWLVTVSEHHVDTVPTPHRDHVPNQVDAIEMPRFALFP